MFEYYESASDLLICINKLEVNYNTIGEIIISIPRNK